MLVPQTAGSSEKGEMRLDTRYTLKVEQIGLADELDVGVKEMTPKFLAWTCGQQELFPLRGKTEEEPGLGS